MSVDDYPAAHTPAGPETSDLDALLTALDRFTAFVGESPRTRPHADFYELLALDQEVSSLCQVTGITLPPITYVGTYGDHFVGFSRIPVTRTTAGCLIWVDPGWLLAMRGLRRTVELMRDRRRTQAGARQVEGTGKRNSGRPLDTDPKADARLCRDWQAAKASGMRRAEFARARGISVGDLIQAQQREKYRRQRDAE
jgi:hypothetical protein